jgi:hypothetical protein
MELHGKTSSRDIWFRQLDLAPFDALIWSHMKACDLSFRVDLGGRARRATGAKANTGRRRWRGQAALKGRFGHVLFGVEDMLERQAVLGLAGTKPYFELGLAAAQAVESNDLGQSGFHHTSDFFVNILTLPADLERRWKAVCSSSLWKMWTASFHVRSSCLPSTGMCASTIAE